ncbi:UNVERIFIED_CONTAM: hypothetical protein Sradi_2983400 [Sesamum radiatum]|uniref:Uncharacterized protein n=1 Tax=Sesamum radiatum TaxID=300843 RepID=A0AAW2S2B1_SESRA
MSRRTIERILAEVQHPCPGGAFSNPEVKASTFSQGLLNGDFFKSLAKKPVSKFDALLARAAKYINIEDAQVAKKKSRGEKEKEETPSKKPQTEFREKKAPCQRNKRSIHSVDGTHHSSPHGSRRKMTISSSQVLEGRTSTTTVR